MPTPKILGIDNDINWWSGWDSLSDEAIENLERAEVVRLPVAMIENDVLRGYCIYVLAHSSPKYWSAPSSTSGKHHPKSHNVGSEVVPGVRAGGLMTHIWHVLAASFDAMRRYGYNSRIHGEERDEWAKRRDLLAFAALTHDWCKCGDPTRGEWGKHTLDDHGEYAADLLEGEMLDRFLLNFPEIRGEAEEDLTALLKEACFAIRHHYGVWSQAGWTPSDERLNDLARMHMEGDYWTTRRFLGGFDGREVLKMLRRTCPDELSGCQTHVSRVTPEETEEVDEGAAGEVSDYMW